MTPSVDHPGLVSGVLLGSGSAGAERTARDWVVDVAVVLGSVLSGLVLLGAVKDEPEDLVALFELVVGIGLSIALFWRRRWPVQVAVVAALLSAGSIMAGAPAAFALFAVAVHRRLTDALLIGALGLAASAVLYLIHPDGESFLFIGAFSVLFIAGIIAWGAFVRARRQLVVSLRDRVAQAEAQQRLLADQARQSERARIAREMHDVVAHRVSIVALHAGGLQVRPDLPPEQVRDTAALIRASAQDALDELRAVIGVLRETADELDRPQPTLEDLPVLVDQSRVAGAKVRLVMDVVEPPPGGLARDAYRVVQESLTNAHKHAPGTAVTVTVRGAAGAGLSVQVRNRLPLRAPDGAMRGAGAGLLGLSERVQLSGGQLTHGPKGGDFVVAATLPWEHR